jgi:hypothetical protein
MDIGILSNASILVEDLDKSVSLKRSNSERLSRIGSETDNVQDIRQLNRMLMKKATQKKKVFEVK